MLISKKLYDIFIVVVFLSAVHPHNAQVEMNIANPKPIHYVLDNITINWQSNPAMFTELFWRNGAEDNWRKIKRFPNRTRSFDWTIPYISKAPIDLLLLASKADSLELIWEKLDAHTGEARYVSFSPDLKYIVSCSDYVAKIWDVKNKQLIQTIDLSITGRARSINCFHSIDTLIITSINSVYLYDRISGTFHDIARDYVNGATHVAKIHPTKPLIVFGGGAGKLVVYDIQNAMPYKLINVGENVQYLADIYCVNFSQTGDSVVCGTYGGYFYVTNIEIDNAPILKIGRHGNAIGQRTPIYDISFSSDGKTVLSGGADSYVRLWNLDSLKVMQNYQKHNFHVESCDFRPFATSFVSVSLDSTILVWDIESGSISDSVFYGAPVVCSEISSDGKKLVASGRDGSVKLWKFAETLHAKDSISFQSGYLFDLSFADVSGEPAEIKEIPLEISHKYDTQLMPFDSYSIDVYVDYPSSIMKLLDETTIGKYSISINGSTNNAPEQKISAMLLQGESNSGEISIDSIHRINPELYHFIANDSKVEIEQDCKSQYDRQIKLENELSMGIIFNNKTVSIDVNLIEDGHYSIILYDISGNVVDEIFNNNLPYGKHRIIKHIENIVSGIYFVGLNSPSGLKKVEKIVLNY